MPADRAAALALVAFTACTMPTVDGVGPAYDPTALTGGLVYHWQPGRTLSIYIDPAQVPNGLDLGPMTEAAAHRWIAHLAYREYRIRVVGDLADADVLVRDPLSPLAADTTGCGGPGWSDAAGSTFFCPAGDSARTLSLPGPAPGRLKVIVTVDRRAVATDAEFEAVVAHELGHALGIGGHSGDAADVMTAFPSRGAPTARDGRTLRYVIHRRPDITL